MAFSVPTFNLSVSIWRALTAWPGPPDVLTVGNLALGKRTQTGSGTGLPRMELLLPAGTDIRTDVTGLAQDDIVEVPTGSGRFYVAIWVDDVAKGFSNEYRIAILNQNHTIARPPWPAPIP